MFPCGHKDLGNSVSAFPNRGAVCILTSSCIKGIMEGLSFIENGKIPQERKSTRFHVAFCIFIFVLIIISTLPSVAFCLLHHNQSPGFCWAHGSLNGLSPQNSTDIMSWDWELKHCTGFVEEDNKQFLTIEQSGHYFIYAQVYRIRQMNKAFTLQLYKQPNIILNQAVGPKEGDGSGTINFARPFFLNKGDRLYCRRNFDLDDVLIGNLSYWGLFKM